MNNIYFADANTCDGYISFIGEYLKNAKEVIALCGLSEKIRENIFKALRDKFIKEKTKFTQLLGCGEREKIIAIIDGKNKMYVDNEAIPNNFKAEKIIDFSRCYYDLEFINEVNVLKNEINKEKEKMYNELSRAKKIHDEWELVYINNMDFEVLNNETDKLIESILNNKSLRKTGSNVNGFFGSMLADGNVNYIDDLTKESKRRIFIKGRPGTGKSTIMKKIRKAVNGSGFDTKSFYCSFDSKSLDMVVADELRVCIFDATAPHEKSIVNENDELFDVYEIAVKKGTDEKYEKELSDIKKRYDECMKNAKMHLKNCKLTEEKIENILTCKINYDKLIKIAKTI